MRGWVYLNLYLYCRFRVVLLAEDRTEAFNFVLLDRAAKRLVGRTATKLIAEGNEVFSKFTPFDLF